MWKTNIKNLSVISNNCIAGVLYRDNNMSFLSLTINLLLEMDGYVKFYNNLENYVEFALKEVYYDLGYLLISLENKISDGEVVLIHFMYYKTFNETKKAWKRRIKRINYDNLLIIPKLVIKNNYYLRVKRKNAI